MLNEKALSLGKRFRQGFVESGGLARLGDADGGKLVLKVREQGDSGFTIVTEGDLGQVTGVENLAKFGKNVRGDALLANANVGRTSFRPYL